MLSRRPAEVGRLCSNQQAVSKAAKQPKTKQAADKCSVYSIFLVYHTQGYDHAVQCWTRQLHTSMQQQSLLYGFQKQGGAYVSPILHSRDTGGKQVIQQSVKQQI